MCQHDYLSFCRTGSAICKIWQEVILPRLSGSLLNYPGPLPLGLPNEYTPGHCGSSVASRYKLSSTSRHLLTTHSYMTWQHSIGVISFHLIPFCLTKSANVSFRLIFYFYFYLFFDICEGGLEGVEGWSSSISHVIGINSWSASRTTGYVEGNYPLCMWNMYSLDAPCTNNNTEGWHSKIHKLVGKAYPSIYKAELFKAEQRATEVSLMQLAAGGPPLRRRRKYIPKAWKRLLTIKEKYEAGDYTLSELVKALSNWVSFKQDYTLTTLMYSHCPKNF